MSSVDFTKIEKAATLKGSTINPDPATGAAERGQRVVLPGPRDVFVDIDSDAAYAFLQERLADLSKHGFPLVVVSDGPSRSGLPHRHVYLRASRDLQDAERIAVQAVLGSDIIREFLSLVRLWGGGPGTTFYEDFHDHEVVGAS